MHTNPEDLCNTSDNKEVLRYAAECLGLLARDEANRQPIVKAAAVGE